MQRFFRAGLRAFVAENALCPVFALAGFFVDLHVHRTYLQAFTAVDAFPVRNIQNMIFSIACFLLSF